MEGWCSKNVMITCYIAHKSWAGVCAVSISSLALKGLACLWIQSNMTFACQDPIYSPGWNLLCRLRSSKIICGQIWEGNWYGSKWQMTAATGPCANVCEGVCPKRACACLFKCFLYACPRVCARDPSSGSYYKAVGDPPVNSGWQMKRRQKMAAMSIRGMASADICQPQTLSLFPHLLHFVCYTNQMWLLPTAVTAVTPHLHRGLV